MAEARIHLLLDTVVRAHTQLDEQKHYCLASLDTLVKLLPIGKSKGGRRKGLRVFNTCGLQDSSRNLQTSSVRASPRAATLPQECESPGCRDEVPEAVHKSEAPKGRASSGKCRASGNRELEAVQRFSEGEPVPSEKRVLPGDRQTSQVPEAVPHIFEDEPVSPKERASSRKSPASGVPEPVQQFSEGEAVAPRECASSRKHVASWSEDQVPVAVQHFSEGETVLPNELASTRKHGASTPPESWESRDQLPEPSFKGDVVSPRVKGQESGSRDEVPGAVEHFSEAEPSSSRKHRASGALEPAEQLSKAEAVAPRVLASSRKRQVSDQVPEAVQHVVEDEELSPKELASTRKHQVWGSPDEVPGAVQHSSEAKPASMRKYRASGASESVQLCVGEAVAPRECASSMDQGQLQVFCEDEAVSPKEPASTRKRQASKTPDEVPRKGVPEPVQQFSEGKNERASSRKRQASVARDQVSECGSPHAGAEEEVQSVKRRQTLRSWHSRASSAAGERPECGSRNSEHRVIDYFSGGEAGASEELGEDIPSEAPGPVESRGQVSEPGGSLKSNLVASVRSFLPLVVQQPAVPIANGKKDVRVKALEAADAARRLEEKRLEERKRKFESLKLEKSLEQKTRLDQEKQKQRKKDEERKKKELELNVKKRKKEEVEKKEREEKRRKVEDAMRLKKEQEEKLRAELEEKEQRRKAMEEAERERKALEEEMKRQKRLEKERENERRRKADEDAKAAWLASKEAERKRREETFQRMKVLEKEQRSRGAAVLATSELPIRGTSLNLAKKSLGLDGAGEKLLGTPALRIRSCGGSRMLPVVPISDLEESDEDEPASYEISPYKSSSEDEGEGQKQKKVKTVPRWARKENLMLHLMRQVHIDPDAIFSGAKSCSLNEVFGTTGNKKRRDFSQRSGSGDWVADLVTWKEELEYKKTMGYLQPRAG